MNRFTKLAPTSPGYFVWRFAADCPERLIKVVLHQGLLLTDNAEHPRLMDGEWCELVARNESGLRFWEVGQIWITEHQHLMKVNRIDDQGIASISMIFPNVTKEHSQKFIPASWKLVVKLYDSSFATCKEVAPS